MTDSGSRDPHPDDVPDGDPLRVGRGLVEDGEESGRTSGRTVTDDGAIEREFVEGEKDGREIEREHPGGHGSLGVSGLGIHVMDSDGIDSPTE